MNLMLNSAYFEKLEFDIHQLRPIKRIKIISQFYAYLSARFTEDVVLEKDNDSPRGYISKYTGLPIEIDNTINSYYYELEY